MFTIVRDYRLSKAMRIAIYAVTMLVGWPWGGFVIAILWGWFLVPFGLPSITWAEALGIAMVLALFTHQYSSDDESDREFFAKASSQFTDPLMFLIMGYVVLQFIDK